MTDPSTPSAGRLAGRVAFVSGGASGIGLAAARLFAAEGAQVAVADIDAPAAEAAAGAIAADGGEAAAVPLDVTDEAGWDRAVASVAARWGAPNAWIFSAGIADSRPVADTALADWRRVMAVNLDGVFLGTRAAIRAMRRGGRGGGQGGSIVILSSVSGMKAVPGAGAYAASKAALRLFAKSAALEVAGENIRINTVLPGGVATPIWRG
ncbi:MAG TPA: SDR family NAD(P)-dependent oxidoreductase, partial [Alphaproteobacteria bacterium]|nr:SDR family NAD(P)-dependent oxidoreductase [Alphaproteobacteria bacterium]